MVESIVSGQITVQVQKERDGTDKTADSDDETRNR
jgi:hypothetical protein